jgi:hypothetical protein
VKLAPPLALSATLVPGIVLAMQTVCTITVNSADEKDALRQRLPASGYRFVELVDGGREDWLRNSCRRGVQCDVLVISGHFNAGETFYSDRIDRPEHLAIDELERAACSDSCPGLFAHLKEVYLFGCESLNPDSSKYSSSYGESGRERMRRIFSRVPSIYGFSGAAPVGPTAAMLLNRYFDGGAGSFAQGTLNARLLSVFSRNSMTRVPGAGTADAAHRARICRFFDERTSAAGKLQFVHGLLRDGDIGTYLKRMESLWASFSDAERQEPAFTEALAQLSADEATRARFLAFTRASPRPAQRARMIELAASFGWLDPGQRRHEEVALVNDMLAARTLGFTEVDLICGLAADGRLGAVANELRPPAAGAMRIGHSAALACLGDAEAHQRTLRALVSPDEGDARIAQAYLRHRPIREATELRPVARAVAQMPGSIAKVRALDALARLRISDQEVLQELTRSFAEARSASVQNAIAEIFLRSDYRAPDLAAVLKQHRLSPAGKGEIVDVLIGRLGNPAQ